MKFNMLFEKCSIVLAFGMRVLFLTFNGFASGLGKLHYGIDIKVKVVFFNIGVRKLYCMYLE